MKKFSVIISGGKTLTYIFRVRPAISSILAALLTSFMGYSYAQVMPTGGQTVAGSATISQTSASYMRIDQATDRAALNWESFSIGSGGHVQFFQPGASSVALNRVVGSNASTIYGQLSANGQVFLVNPHGTLFARGAQVDVGGLVASTLNISDADFMAGNYAFANDGSNGSVVNQGTINAGYAALLAPQVSNEGTIVARTGGTVALAAGDRINLDFVGDNLITVNVSSAALNASVANSGAIQADGGNVLLTARSANALLDTVINMEGVVKANSLVNRNGTIILDGGNAGVVSVTGTLDASGKTPSPLAGEGGGEGALSGGTVKVLGDKVGLFGTANINVSGNVGGGTALIGGNFQGKGPEQNAAQTYVSSGATINADAVNSGDGGKVIVWADGTTRFSGSISAKGGSQGGNGGFVEVSGKGILDFRGMVDTSAAMGRTGTLLLDPTEITIVNAAAGAGTNVACAGGGTCTVPAGPGPFTDTSTGAGSLLNDGTLNLQLAINNVTVSATNDIVVDAAAAIDLQARGLTLTSTAGGITFGATTIAATGGGTLGLNFATLLDLSANPNFTAVTTVTANGGGTGTIAGPNIANAWALSGTTGSLTNASGTVGFSGVPSLQGGSLVDTFTLGANSTANIAGMGGIDVLALAGFTLTGSYAGGAAGGTITGIGSAAISGSGATTGVDGTSTNVSANFTDVTSITSSSSGTLTGSANANAWALSGAGGTYTDGVGAGAAAFSGFASLTGGAGSDTIIGAAQTYTLHNATANAGGNGTVNWTSIENLTDSGVGIFNMGAGGSVSGTLTAVGGTVNYGSYATPATFALGGGASTGMGGWSGITTVTGSAGSDAITGMGATAFNLTGPTAGTAAGITFSGFEAANTTTVTGTTDFDHGLKIDNGMAFASATSVTGTGGITNMGATAFNLTGANNAGAAGGITYTGFTTADTTTVTGTSGFDHGLKSDNGIVFANATSVTGTGGITNMAAVPFNATTGVAGTITYTGFTAADTTAITGATGFNDGAKTSGAYTFANAMSVTGSGALTNVAGNFAIDTLVSAATGVDYSAGFTSVAGTGAGTITGSGATYNLTGPNQGNNGPVSWTSFANLAATGASTINGSGGSLSGSLSSAGTSTLTGTITTTGTQTYTGAVSAGAVTLNAGSSAITANNAANDFTGTVTATGNTIQITDANTLTAALTDGGSSTLVAGALVLGNITAGGTFTATASSGISRLAGTTITATTATLNATGGNIGGAGNAQADAITFSATPASLTYSAPAANVNLGNLAFSGSEPAIFQFTAAEPATVFWNGVSTTPQAAGLSSAVAAAQAAAMASASEAVAASFGTASIAQQIANGFAGEIGMSPPGIDNIVDDGIRMPGSSSEEEERKRRR